MKNLFFEVLKSFLNGETSYVAQSVFSNKKVLDIGCGKGIFLKDCPNAVGIDSDKVCVDYCKSKKFKVVIGDVTKMPFIANCFEGGACLQVIEHLNFRDAHSMLSEAHRVIKKNGILALSTEMPVKKFWDTFSHVRPYTPTALHKMFTYDGMETLNRLNFEEVGIYFMGKDFEFLPLDAISFMIANLTPFNRRNYTIILKVKK